jgi:hypothetical protein
MRIKVLIEAIVLMAFSGQALASEAVENAKLLCKAADQKISSAPCAFSAEEHAITVSINTIGGDAREFCHQTQVFLMQEHIYFDGDLWRLNIKSPYSGNNTIAFCDLPQTPH